MLGEKKLKKIFEMLLHQGSVDQIEILYSSSKNALTRFANNEIHQNMAWRNLFVSIRVIIGKKIGVAQTSSIKKKSLDITLNKAIEIAKNQQSDPDFVTLPVPKKTSKLSERVSNFSIDKMGKGAGSIIEIARKKQLTASGAYACEISEVAVANSLGVFQYHKSASVNLSTVILADTSSGFASQVAKNQVDIRPQEVGEVAVYKALESAKPRDLPPDDYEVILEPQAVSEIMSFLSWYGPNARIYHEGASCFSKKMDQQVFGSNINIIDDPFHELVFPMPFDYEGFPKKKLEIVKNGVLKNIAYDSYHANKFGMQNTGHALPAPNTIGPVPLHMYIKEGNETKTQMIKNVKKGLLITRFWYVRVLNPKTLNITGMTRDGTFLIKDGEVVGPVKNMRFNQSIPEALNNVIAIENKLNAVGSFEGEMISLSPTLHIGKWSFSSSTLF